MRIYLAGPMRGKPEWNRDAFDKAEGIWQEAGWTVFNPHKIGAAAGYKAGETDGNCPIHLRHVMLSDMVTIAFCDAVAVLPGWEESQGATAEVAFALFLGLPIYDAVTMKKLDIRPKPWRTLGSLDKVIERYAPSKPTT